MRNGRLMSIKAKTARIGNSFIPYVINILQYSMPWYAMVWHGMAWHGMAWHGMAWHGMAWHGIVYRDYFMVGECVRFLFTSCEGSLNERVSAANE